MNGFTKTIIIAAAVWLCGASGATAQFLDSGGGPAENNGNRGSRAPGILVREGITNFLQGPEITRPEPVKPNYRLLLTDELLRNVFAQLNVLISLLPTVLQPGNVVPPPGGNIGGGGGNFGGGQIGQLVMTEIAHNGSVAFVELLNLSGVQTRINGFRFADGSSVSPALPQIELDLNDTIVIQLGGETQNSLADVLLGFRVQSVNVGELALYNFQSAPEGELPTEDSSFMIDYIQWNNDPRQDPTPPLESVASQANLWTSIDFINTSLSGMSFRLNADAERRINTGSRDFDIVPFAENTLRTAESQRAAMRSFPVRRINR
jgi:hypothetical protein